MNEMHTLGSGNIQNLEENSKRKKAMKINESGGSEHKQTDKNKSLWK